MLHARYCSHACSDLQEHVLVQKLDWLHSVAGYTPIVAVLDCVQPQPNLAWYHQAPLMIALTGFGIALHCVASCVPAFQLHCKFHGGGNPDIAAWQVF